MQEVSPNPIDPIAMAAATSAGYTPQMHQEAQERLLEQIHDSKQSRRTMSPQVLDLYERAIYHASYTEKPVAALDLYDNQLGGYEYLAGRLGEYRRGLRITSFLMSVLGADYMDVLASPAHDHSLYLIVLGQPESAEQQTHRLLQQMRKQAQTSLGDGTEDYWANPLGFWKEHSDRGFVMYEAVLLQTLCDVLLVQGKLWAAETSMDEVLNQPHEWGPFGPSHKSRNGSNPYARRALARALMGDVTGALDDFKAADTFAAKYTKFTMFPSHDWHHRTHYAAFLARLGYLSGAQRQLHKMNIERIRAYRPLTTAEYDLASAEIAYAYADYSGAEEHAERVLGWATEAGHKQIYVRALVVLARLQLHAGNLDQTDLLLSKVQTEALAAGFEIQRLDSLILLGHRRLTSGDIHDAETAASEAETVSQQQLYRWGIGDAAHLLARCAEVRGEVKEALLHGERALQMREQIQDPKATHTRALIEHIMPKLD